MIAARADIEYSVVKGPAGIEVVLASAAVSRYFPDGAEEVARVTGRELAGSTYRPPFDTPGPGVGRYRVVLDDFVTVEEGTGFVHVAPSFGPDDLRIGTRERVGVFDPLDGRGHFTDRVPLVAGKAFKAADPILSRDLEDRGLLFRSESLRHTYPFCWRCDSALLYRALDSWFVRSSRVTEALVRHNRAVRWIPASYRDGRFGNFLTEAKDWALSRSRYWGTPLPIWVCDAGHATCVGSFSELAERATSPLPQPFDPHGVTVDRLTLRCATCGHDARREAYTIDAWYDAGAAPFAQYHYPFEPGPFDPHGPLDYIAEGLDQTRGWFYTLLVLAVTLFDRPAYRTCVTTGLVLDESGRKMSKSKGNALEPLTTLERLGGDAARWGFLALDYTEPMRVSEASIEKAAARTIGTLRHVVAFHLDNARADKLPPRRDPPYPPGVLDRWLLSRLEGTRVEVERSLESFDPRDGATAIRSFVDDLSTWYLRRSRPRFWGETTHTDREHAHATLSYALLGLARTAAPLLPFTAEWVHQEVGGEGFSSAERSVHFTAWPSELAARDPTVERGMEELRRLVEVGRELRQRAAVKARVPLLELVVFGAPGPDLAALGEEATELLASELNVRRVVRMAATLRTQYPDSDWVVREDGGVPVAALPRRPTEELLEEGLAREVARRLQQRRKELGLLYSERVRVAIAVEGPLRRAVEPRREALAKELLADSFELASGPLPPGPGTTTWEFEGFTFSARVERAAPAAPR